ncbi:uncharacterized protein V1518DRAFT_423249 [Limtongia smithiae]|uniref:uncharacterized protein n=1 Tax=Limtongia smithiae TaxID=1125753 RepID=UPI0034CE115F
MVAPSVRPFARQLALASARSSVLPASRLLLPATLVARRSVSSRYVNSTEEQAILTQQRSNRPISPHLTIYKPQISWILSGFHRLTGVVLAGGFYVLGLSYVVAPVFGMSITSTAIAASFGALPLAVKLLAKTAASLPFTFHFYNGVRHLVWDATYLVNNAGVKSGGLTVLGLTTITSLVLLFI